MKKFSADNANNVPNRKLKEEFVESEANNRLTVLIKQYELAIGLWNAQHQAIWSMFNSVMMTNSIFIAAIVIVLSGDTKLSNPIAVTLCTAGFFINIVWLIINWRGFNYQTIRITQARKYEDKINNISTEFFDLIRNGGKFSKKGYSSFLKRKFGLSSCALIFRRLKTEYTSRILIIIFIISYVLMLYWILNCFCVSSGAPT